MAYSTGKKKNTKPKDLSVVESYKKLPTAEKVFMAPGYAFSYGMEKTFEAADKMKKTGRKVINKAKEIKGDYERGKKMREQEQMKMKKTVQAKPAMQMKKTVTPKPAMKKTVTNKKSK